MVLFFCAATAFVGRKMQEKYIEADDTQVPVTHLKSMSRFACLAWVVSIFLSFSRPHMKK